MTTINKKSYCGDCVHLILKRDKDGVVTGEMVCALFDQQRSAFQYLKMCSRFFPKSVVPELVEACKGYRDTLDLLLFQHPDDKILAAQMYQVTQALSSIDSPSTL